MKWSELSKNAKWGVGILLFSVAALLNAVLQDLGVIDPPGYESAALRVPSPKPPPRPAAEPAAKPDAEEEARKLIAAAERRDVVNRLQLPGWALAAAPTPYSWDGVTVTVNTAWLAVPRQLRLTQARTLWKQWASLRTPTDVDRSLLTLVDVNGHKVGGSGIMGSSISLE